MTIKLEVGKTYLTRDGQKRHCIGINKWHMANNHMMVVCDDKGAISARAPDGLLLSLTEDSLDLVKEYKKPVVHKKEIFWAKYKPKPSDEVFLLTFILGGSPDLSLWVVLKQETISYTEEQ